MDKTPTISIIVPVYNVEKYLRQCIDSILAQTYTDFELLLIDDGSPDNSGNICDEYAQKDTRIRVFHKPNGGVSTARNLGIDNARGEYISFIDADDYVEPNFLEEMLNAMNRYNADLVCCGLWENEKSNDINKRIRSTDRDKIYDMERGLIELIVPDAYFGWCFNKFYKRSIVKNADIKFPEGIRYSEDWVFIINYIIHSSKIVYISKVLYHYMLNETSAINKISTNKGFDYNYLDRLKADEISYTMVKSLKDKSVMNVFYAYMFYSASEVARRFIPYYNGDKKTLHVLRRLMIKCFPYYLKNPRFYLKIKKKDAQRLVFRVCFPSLHHRLHEIKSRLRNGMCFKEGKGYE